MKDVKDSKAPSEKIVLETQNLTIRFGGLTAVKELNLSIPEGYIFGLIGPNGAGKTTVFNMVTQHYKPTEGKILYYGQPLSVRPDVAVKMGIAPPFQNIRLFGSMNVRDNIIVAMHGNLNISWIKSMLGTRDYRIKWRQMQEKADELLEKVGLSDVAYEKATGLPYGLQRRLEIARALATEPKLLLLDEPAAGMNPQEIVDLLDFVRKVRDEFHLTVFIIEHHMSLIMKLCDRIAVINYGEKIAEGNAEEIQSHPEVIEAYLGVDDIVKG